MEGLRFYCGQYTVPSRSSQLLRFFYFLYVLMYCKKFLLYVVLYYFVVLFVCVS